MIVNQRRESLRKVVSVIKRANSRSNKGRLAASAIERIPVLIEKQYDAESGGCSNCWGTTLYTLGTLPKLAFIGGTDMDSWLADNTTRVKRPAFGDILVIRYGQDGRDCYCTDNEGNELAACCGGEDCDQVGELMHTAVYVGAGLYWHQEGMGGPFLLGTLDDVLCSYDGDWEHVRRIDHELSEAA